MTRYVFRYVPFRGAAFPIVPISLKTSTSFWFTTNALLDSGATISLFDGAVARILGISIGKGKRIRPVGIGGAIRAYTHKLTLKVGDEEFEGEVAFSSGRGIPINLLGRTSVFERFLVSFDESNQRTILETA